MIKQYNVCLLCIVSLKDFQTKISAYWLFNNEYFRK